MEWMLFSISYRSLQKKIQAEDLLSALFEKGGISMRKRNHKLYKILLALSCAGAIGLAVLWGIQTYVKVQAKDRILSVEEALEQEEFDCILVLGCKIKPDGSPSNMLEDRLETGVTLWQKGASQKLLMSGDHGRVEYNEVGAMKQYALDKGVPSSAVFMDHAGFSTYDSIYRVKEIFEARKVLIVTQEYHLYRALYLAEKMGVDAYGVPADLRTYYGQTKRDVREVLARVKDFFKAFVQAKPIYLGDVIPINGDGDVTND